MSRLQKLVNKQKSKIATIRTGSPTQKLKIIGVIGTRGKTTVTHMIKDLLEASGFRVGFISSLGYSLDGETVKTDIFANHLDAGTLHKLLKKMVSKKVDFAIVELTSKNELENKYVGLNFDVIVLTNIYNDNVSKYKNFGVYAQSKINLINRLKDQGLVIFSAEDANLVKWLKDKGNEITKNVYMQLAHPKEALHLTYDLEGIRFFFNNRRFELPVIGGYNLINALLSLKSVFRFVNPETTNLHFTKVSQLPGRMDIIQKDPYSIIIDYSYTPEMLEDSLKYLAHVKEPTSRLICVFGCAGERDKKRRRMGEIAARYASVVILTSEDPKAEKVADINSEIYKYAENIGGVMLERFESNEEYVQADKKNLKHKVDFIIQNSDVPFVAFDADNYSSRLDAIDYALHTAQEGDIVYITGKGPETSLIFKNVEYEWSDYEAVKEVLKHKNNQKG